MAKCTIDGIDVETSSGNVFADLGLADAEQLKIKSRLVIEITRAVRRRCHLNQPKTNSRLGTGKLVRSTSEEAALHKLIQRHKRPGTPTLFVGGIMVLHAGCEDFV